jgi:hypothetical protein
MALGLIGSLVQPYLASRTMERSEREYRPSLLAEFKRS